jgi:hypothetical protein
MENDLFFCSKLMFTNGKIIVYKFWFIWPSGFREDFLDIDQSETRIAGQASDWNR